MMCISNPCPIFTDTKYAIIVIVYVAVKRCNLHARLLALIACEQ